jgi:hypothetical protein
MKRNRRLGLVVLALLFAVVAAQAQEKDPRLNPPLAPLPPASTGDSSSRSAPADTAPAAPALAPDQRPLSGVEPFTLGLPSGGRSTLRSSLDVSFHGDTNPRIAGQGDTVRHATTLQGRVSLDRQWSRYLLSLDYGGGGTIYGSDNQLSRSHHSFSARQTITGRRWSLLFTDRFSFVPESANGGGLSLLPGGLNSNLVPLNPQLLPNVSILTGRSSRLSNTALGQFDYQVGRRSSITFSGGHGILRFLDDAFVDNSNVTFGAGYNYAPTARDTIALGYNGGLVWFDTQNQSIQHHAATFSYGRRITGRLAVNVSAGPQIRRFENPLSGHSQVLSWTMSGGLNYQFPQTSVRLDYHHGVTGGAGVFRGAETDQVSVRLHRPLTRMWSGSLSAGYARNRRFQQTSGVTGDFGFDTWNAGVHFLRPLGRQVNMSLNYSVQHQKSTNSLCVGATCGRVYVRHVFGVSFHFQLPPVAIE